MKVILINDVKKVGKKNQIVEVSQGYANNFLIKKNLAVEATKINLKQLNTKIQKLENQEEEKIKEAEQIKQQIENEKIIFNLKSGINGNVFGSISTKQISAALTKRGYKLDKHAIICDPINYLGHAKIKVKLHKKVNAILTIKIEGK